MPFVVLGEVLGISDFIFIFADFADLSFFFAYFFCQFVTFLNEISGFSFFRILTFFECDFEIPNSHSNV